MKVYDIVYEEGQNEGVYALGMVYDPAMQDIFVSLNKEDIKLSIDEEKRMVFGAVLIPNKDIPRTDDKGNTFALRFSEDTIEKLGHNWISKGKHVNFTEQHEKPIEGISAVEMWTVKDSEKDTSNFYGKTYPKGTLVALSKVNNEDTWQKIKNGEINGYSIEAILGLKEINLKSNMEMTKENQKSFADEVVSRIKAFLNTDKEDIQAAPVEDLTNEPEVEVQAEPTPEVSEEPAFDKDAFMQSVIETVKAEFKNESDKTIEAKDAKIAELEAKLAKQPEAETVTVTPTTHNVELNSQGQLLELLRQNK